MRNIVLGLFLLFFVAPFTQAAQVSSAQAPRPHYNETAYSNPSSDIQPKEMERPKGVSNKNKTKKELHPMLSRGLVMTILGGCLTGLAIALYPFFYAVMPLIVIMGIIFLVGLVYLFIYLANPKMREEK